MQITPFQWELVAKDLVELQLMRLAVKAAKHLLTSCEVSPLPELFLLNSLSKLLMAMICIMMLRWILSSKFRLQ